MKALFMFSQFTLLTSSFSCILSCYSWLSWNIILSKILWTFKLKELWLSQMIMYEVLRYGRFNHSNNSEGKEKYFQWFFPEKAIFIFRTGRPTFNSSERPECNHRVVRFHLARDIRLRSGVSVHQELQQYFMDSEVPVPMWPSFEARKDISNLFRYLQKF